MSKPRFSWLTVAVMIPALVGALAGLGCGSMGTPASASFASVTLTGPSDPAIRSATTAVFREAGYRGYSGGLGEMIFDQEASRASTIARDGPIGAHEGAVTLDRVRVELVEVAAGTYRLQCHAFKVSGAGDSFREDEHRLANFRSRPYQQLLDKVAQRLAQSPNSSASNPSHSDAP